MLKNDQILSRATTVLIQTDYSLPQKVNTLKVRFKPLRFPPKRYKKLVKIKEAIGCISWDLVYQDGKPLKIRGYEYNYHNLFHYEISCLERIQIGRDLVSGIHGFYSPMFHDTVIEPEYDGILDEARLTIHEWLTRTSLFGTLKAFNWMICLASMKINPIDVVIRHGKSIKNYQGNILFDFNEPNKYNLYRLLTMFNLI